MGKSTSRAGQTAKTTQRRKALGRNIPRPTPDLRQVFTQPEFVKSLAIMALMLVVISTVVVWSRTRVLERPGQLMTETRLNRLDFWVDDEKLTELKRDEARKAAPQIYELRAAILDKLEGDLSSLPVKVAGKTSVEELTTELRQQYGITDESLRELQKYVIDGKSTDQWKAAVQRLRRELGNTPLLTTTDYQNYWVSRDYSNLSRLVRGPGGESVQLSGQAIEIPREPTAEFEQRIRQLVRNAEFPTQIVPIIASKIVADRAPTVTYDPQATTRIADEAAAAVAAQVIEHSRDDVIYRAGDVLDAQQYEQLVRENAVYLTNTNPVDQWLQRMGMIGLLLFITIFLASYITLFQPRITRNPLRVFAITTLMSVMLALSVTIAPTLPFLAAIAPTLFVTVILLIAYDQRLAFVVSLLQAALITLAMEQTFTMYLLLISGCATMASQLREVRTRNSLVRATTITAAVLGAGTYMHGLVQVPIQSPEIFKEISISALWAVAGTFGVGFLTLGILPSIEKLFDIVTGMTLAELRDPKQALLRQLQQKAPGTYNHSLQVANIAEAAADAIGADGLLVYVGALYHDIGKMNKPEYFVENQTGGANKHEKLSPAMSLLVIIGHVKDGVELAREYNLPRKLIHFIEAHHGTTLVEYFYHAAKTQAGEAGTDVEEFSFRYPGPKPQTKEAAILMLSDAVESATRAMTEPNPARIENLVRTLSKKRLQDGQFDECDLTFRELSQIEEAVIGRVCAIHHGRIAYPKGEERTEERALTDRQRKSVSA